LMSVGTIERAVKRPGLKIMGSPVVRMNNTGARRKANRRNRITSVNRVPNILKIGETGKEERGIEAAYPEERAKARKLKEGILAPKTLGDRKGRPTLVQPPMP